MKSIVILGDSLSGGGVQRVILNLSKGFADAGCNVHILLLKDSVQYDIPQVISLDIIKLGGIFSKIAQLRPYLQAIKIKKFLKLYDCDFFISNFSHFSGMKTVDLVGHPKTITILHNTQSKRRFKRHRGGDSLLKKYKIKKIAKSFMNKKLVCVSNGVRDDVIKNFGVESQNAVTIYNPFNFLEIRREASLQNDNIPKEPYILHVGRYELEHKRQDLLLQAYASLDTSYKLVLLGDGKDRDKIENLIHSLGLSHKVILAGFDSNPYNWMENAKLFVMSSDYEGFGMVIVEALSLKTPVVSTNCKSGPSEILIDELGAFLTPVGDVNSLSNTIKKALEKYPEISEKYINRFSVDNIVKQYLSL